MKGIHTIIPFRRVSSIRGFKRLAALLRSSCLFIFFASLVNCSSAPKTMQESVYYQSPPAEREFEEVPQDMRFETLAPTQTPINTFEEKDSPEPEKVFDDEKIGIETQSTKKAESDQIQPITQRRGPKTHYEAMLQINKHIRHIRTHRNSVHLLTRAGSCQQTCELSSAICYSSTQICSIAYDFPQEPQFSERCRWASDECQDAQNACVSCRNH